MHFSRSAFVTMLLTITILTGLLTLIGILLIPAELATPERPVQENISGIGYTDYPDSKGLLFTDEQGRGAFVFLDFENIVTQVYLFEDNASQNAEKLSYKTDYTFLLPDGFLGALCDRLGGIEMTDDSDEKYLFFSASLEDFRKKDLNYDKMLKISVAFFEKIANSGLSSEDFMFIIELTQTDISYSVCYDWITHMQEMLSNYIIN